MNPRRLFTEHPDAVGKSYVEHMKVALSFAGPLTLAGLMAFVHAFLPFLFVTTASGTVKRLHARMVNRLRSLRSSATRPCRRAPCRPSIGKSEPAGVGDVTVGIDSRSVWRLPSVMKSSRPASRWAPRPAPGWPDGLILFDGVCVLAPTSCAWCSNGTGRTASASRRCNRIGQALSRELGIDPTEPETNAVILDGVAYMKSDANLVVFPHLRGKARLAVFRHLPRGFRDFLYDRVARNRYRLFGRTETCMLPPPGTEGRFLDSLEDLLSNLSGERREFASPRLRGEGSAFGRNKRSEAKRG